MGDHLANGIVGWRRNSWALVAGAARTDINFFTLTLKQQPLSTGDTKAGPLIISTNQISLSVVMQLRL